MTYPKLILLGWGVNMNSEKLANWLQIGGNLGILAGLVLVAVEINQNTASVQGSAYQQWVAANMELNMAATDPTLSHLFVLGNADSANLSNESFVSFAMWNLGLMQMAQATDYLYRTGSLDRDLWETEINRAAGILAFPGVRQWWDAGGERGFFRGDVFVPESRKVEPDSTTQ